MLTVQITTQSWFAKVALCFLMAGLLSLVRRNAVSIKNIFSAPIVRKPASLPNTTPARLSRNAPKQPCVIEEVLRLCVLSGAAAEDRRDVQPLPCRQRYEPWQDFRCQNNREHAYQLLVLK